MSIRPGLIATAALAIGAGNVAAAQEEKVDAIQGALQVVTELVDTRFPQAREVPRTWTMAITDRGSYWDIRFIPRRDILGGGPVFHLEKGSLKVLEAYLEQ